MICNVFFMYLHTGNCVEMVICSVLVFFLLIGNDNAYVWGPHGFVCKSYIFNNLIDY